MRWVESSTILFKSNFSEFTTFSFHRHHFWRSMDRWFHRPSNHTKSLLFLDEVVSLDFLPVRVRLICGDFAYILTHLYRHTSWVRNSPHSCTKFSSEFSWNFSRTFRTGIKILNCCVLEIMLGSFFLSGSAVILLGRS